MSERADAHPHGEGPGTSREVVRPPAREQTRCATAPQQGQSDDRAGGGGGPYH